MPNRILRDGINSSERIESVSEPAELFYRRVMSIVDDYGRFSANPTLIRSGAWPLAPDKHTNQQIEKWLAECENARLLKLYTVGEKRFLEYIDFKQQRRSKSKFPAPHDAAQDDSNLLRNGTSGCAQVDASLQAHNEGLSESRADSNSTTHSTTHSESAPLPYDSIESQHSSSVSDGNGDKEKDPVKPSRTFNADWFEFRDLAESAGMSGSSVDWDKAFGIFWRYLDPAQRAAATQGIRDRIGTDDPALSAIPPNYFERRMWERRVRKPAKQQQLQPSAEYPTLDRRAFEEYRKRMEAAKLQ